MAPPRALISLPILALLVSPLAARAPAASPSAEQTQAQLRSLKERIERVSRDVGHDAVEKDRLARNLRSAELAVATAQADLDELRTQESAHSTQRAELAAERTQVNASLALERAGLATQLQVAYQIGRHEPLQLLLNQRDPAAAARMFIWYGYFGRARATQIAGIAEQVRRIDELDVALAEQEEALGQLHAAKQQRLAQLQGGRAQRQSALTNLQLEARSHKASLVRLRTQQADLEHLLRELARAVPPSAPTDERSSFGRLRGRLDWPVAGRIVASFGQTRASGVDWDGMVVSTQRAAPVRAVAAGRVIYADWLPGLGLLTIVDHGSGYLSLYGYNDQLRRSAGETVAAGDVLASAGDSGGRPEPQLYFEIRRGGKPIDPRPWFRERRP